MQYNQDKRDKKENMEGLPDVAHRRSKKNPIVLVMMGIVVAIALMMYFATFAKHKKVSLPDETFTVTEQEKKLPEVLAAPKAETTSVKETITKEQLALLVEEQKALQQRLSAPLMLVQNQGSTNSTQTKQNANSESVSSDPNTQFLSQSSQARVETAFATTIKPLNSIIAEGSLIHATLESAINSDLPGSLRAVIREAHYSEDGSQVLIPPGTRLIGEYKSGMTQGQARIFVVWKRLLLPNGISIQLASPGVDALGTAGLLADEIDRHFFERFSTATLLSVIGASAANAGVSSNAQDNSAAEYRKAVANSFAASANQSLQQQNMIAPTLTFHQGTPIMVFVARDLHFESAMKEMKAHAIKVF